MELLIVDDEMVAIQGLMAITDWEKLDINRIWTARKIDNAKDIINEEAISIVLCDIEMRNENGLSLVKWIKETHPGIKCIIVTGYVNLDYTRKSIELNVTDYIGKPVKENAIIHAVKKAREQILLAEMQKDRENRRTDIIRQHHTVLKEKYFKQLLVGAEGELPKAEELQKDLDSSSVAGEHFILFFVKVRIWNPEYTEDERENYYSRMTETLIDRYLKDYAVVFCSLSAESGAFYLTEEEIKDFDHVYKMLSKFELYSSDYYGCNICIYYDRVQNYPAMPSAMRSLRKADENNIYEDEGFFEGQSITCVNEDDYELPDIQLWFALMEQKAFTKAQQLIDEYMQDEFTRRALTRKGLIHLYRDYQNNLMVYLHNNGIAVEEIESHYKMRVLNETAARSIKQCRQWMLGTINAVEDLLSDKEEPNVVDQICKYIDDHVDENISREDLSARVFLSVDHLGRLFKKSMGMTIYDYISQQKMQRARFLLNETDLSISEVAEKVGYSNVAHFSEAFRKSAGVSPKQYRKLRDTTAN